MRAAGRQMLNRPFLAAFHASGRTTDAAADPFRTGSASGKQGNANRGEEEANAPRLLYRDKIGPARRLYVLRRAKDISRVPTARCLRVGIEIR